MPWGFHKKPPAGLANDFRAGTHWTIRLSAVGRQLDHSGLDLSDLALSVAGQDVWIVGNAWWSCGEQAGRSNITLRSVGDRLEFGSEMQRSTLSLAAPPQEHRWESAFAAVGQLLDRSQRLLRNPTILQLGEGFVVTADTAVEGEPPVQQQISLSFTIHELEAIAGGMFTPGGRQ
jgi:hypothetical protein